MENIKIKSLGPIAEADINFGDLTFFVQLTDFLFYHEPDQNW